MYILICDDNREDRNCCREQIVKLWGDPQDPLAIEEFASGEELLFRMEDIYSQVDLIYLDIVMSGADGLAVARKLRDLGYLGEIVFFSGTGDYAVRGYDYDALNYIVKGKTTENRFYDILRRAQKRRADRERDVILLNCAGEKRCIALDAIRYFEIIKRVITVHYGRGETFEFYSTMGKLEEELAGKDFIRTHKSFLVNRRYLAKITVRSVTMQDGTQLPAGQRYAAALRNEAQ